MYISAFISFKFSFFCVVQQIIISIFTFRFFSPTTKINQQWDFLDLRQLMHFLRCFSFYCVYYSFQTSCVHVPGVMNTAADA